MDDLITVKCPHCELLIEISKKHINCAIFRHGMFKSNLQQMDPHTPKHICDEVVRANLIYGCGKPFKLFWNMTSDLYWAEKCEYI
jgi:hypothetical protein